MLLSRIEEEGLMCRPIKELQEARLQKKMEKELLRKQKETEREDLERAN